MTSNVVSDLNSSDGLILELDQDTNNENDVAPMTRYYNTDSIFSKNGVNLLLILNNY